MQGYCDIFLWTILKQMLIEAHIYMRRHQGVKVEHFDVRNVIYHKFSHGAISYTLGGENVNIMLEFFLFLKENIRCDPSLEPSRRDGSNNRSHHTF